MRIVIVNDDTRWGSRDPDVARLGAASLAPEYLARALRARGHAVRRQSALGGEQLPGGEPQDAAILSRNRYLADTVEAGVKLLWTGDEHNAERWEDYPDVRTVCTSRYLAEVVGCRVPVAAVVPVGVPDALFGIPIDPVRRVRCYTCGVWDPCRGVLEGMAAFALTASSGARLELFGDGRLWGREPDAYAAAVQSAVAASDGNCVAHGTVSHTAMLAALPRLGILVHLATSETCGVAVTEAMAAGIPVVTTGAAALAELGIERCCQSIDEAADELGRLMADPAYYRRAATHNRECVRDRAWSRVAERWERAIHLAGTCHGWLAQPCDLSRGRSGTAGQANRGTPSQPPPAGPNTCGRIEGGASMRTFAGITYGGRRELLGRVRAAAEAEADAVAVWDNTRFPNAGHTQAVRAMMQQALVRGSDLYLQVSDDAVCQPGYVDAAREVMARDPRIACVCTPQMNVGPFAELSGECKPLAPDGTKAAEGYILECAFVACVFRLEAMADVGLVDTRYFFHSFDTDTCWTLWAHGWRVYQLGAELVEHVEHAEGRNARDLLDPWVGEELRRQDCWRLWEKWSHADWPCIAHAAPYLHSYCVGTHAMHLPWTQARYAQVRHLVR